MKTKALATHGLAGLIFVYNICFCVSAAATGTADAAQETSSKDQGVQGAALGMAAALTSQCGPQNPMACAMAAMALAQGIAAGSAADGASTTASLQSESTTDTVSVGTEGASVEIAELQSELASKGVTVSEDGTTVTVPGGTTVAMDSSSTTASGMQANGFSAGQISAAQAALAEAREKVGKIKSSTSGEIADTGGGGGGGGGSAPQYAKSVVVKKTRRPAANLSGMSKNFGTDKIGVAADHIFEMITRRYKAKDASDTFLKN